MSRRLQRWMCHKRALFSQFPEDGRWHAARAALAPCLHWKGNVSSCREPSGNLRWQISSCSAGEEEHGAAAGSLLPWPCTPKLTLEVQHHTKP
ncbi:hypothetical protein AV530_018436 [Patagioenas fasciata monilis]|uniref:Uncharacterized protein n=1 Tax=Patagioenas fasciata monilis TaxID=372326 RepID=A0A1V4JRX1_PATFA|nr:hypothetical protein AV530_018436 [Patagioenas fasciata monilis]